MLYFFCVECRDKTLRNKRYNAYSVVATHDKCPRVAFAIARQPWAIKGTTLTALHHEGIHIEKFIHWNTGTTPTALPIGSTLNIGCLHLKNMKIFVDVWAFLSQFFISTHIHFMPFTYNPQLAKLKIRMKKDANFIAYTFTS